MTQHSIRMGQIWSNGTNKFLVIKSENGMVRTLIVLWEGDDRPKPLYEADFWIDKWDMKLVTHSKGNTHIASKWKKNLELRGII